MPSVKARATPISRLRLMWILGLKNGLTVGHQTVLVRRRWRWGRQGVGVGVGFLGVGVGFLGVGVGFLGAA